jgi:hypothetical protein
MPAVTAAAPAAQVAPAQAAELLIALRAARPPGEDPSAGGLGAPALGGRLRACDLALTSGRRPNTAKAHALG